MSKPEPIIENWDIEAWQLPLKCESCAQPFEEGEAAYEVAEEAHQGSYLYYCALCAAEI